MSVLFVAGSGTDVGKTHVTAGVVRTLRRAGRPVRALKPLASGVDPPDHPSFSQSDTAILLHAQGLKPTPEAVDACSPWRFWAPLSPDMAALAEGRSLRLDELLDWTRAQMAAVAPGELLVIEGVGGVMSPVCVDATGLDWVAELGCAAMLVGGSYLGAISHTLTALACLRGRGVQVTGVLVNESAGSSVELIATAESLARFAQGCSVRVLRRWEEIGRALAMELVGEGGPPQPAPSPNTLHSA